MALNDKNNKKALTTSEIIEPPEIQYFRELSERFLYWNSQPGETCKIFADNYKKLMHVLTSEE